MNSQSLNDIPILHRLTGANNNRDARFRFAILLIGALVILAMTYGSGMRRQKNQLEAKVEEAKIYKVDLRLTQMELRARDAYVQQLEARRQIALAEAALERSDAGAAQAALADAAARLRTAEQSDETNLSNTKLVGETTEAVNPADPEPLSERVKSLPMQKEAVARVATVLDAILKESAPKADFLTPVTVPPPTLNDVPQTPSVPGNEVSPTR